MKKRRAQAKMFLGRLERSNLSSAEVYYRETRGLDISGYDQQITGIRSYTEEGLSVRTEDGNRIGSSFTELTDRKHLEQALAQAAEQVQYLPPDTGHVLYPGDRELFDDDCSSRELEQIPAERKQDFVLKLERAARALDAKVLSVPTSRYLESHQVITIVNSRGMKKVQRFSSCAALIQVSAGNTRQVHSGSYAVADRVFYHLSPLRIAQEAVMRAVEKMNPRSIDSGTYPVVFSPEAASQLLGAFFLSPYAPWFAENVMKGRSPLAGKIGEQVASPEVTIYDHPEGSSLYARKFDDEGVKTRKLILLQQGVLKEFAHSVYAASRLGTSPTGHGLRASFMAPVVTGLHAPCLTNGEHDLEELFDLCGSGVYITELDGLHAGVDVLTGNFSLSAGGFQIAEGKQKKSVGKCVAAGNIFELLEDIAAKGSDRREDSLQRFSSPSLLVKRLSISA